MVTNSWKIWLVSLAVSLGIFLVIYFTVIKSANDTVDNALQQSQQIQNSALNDANKQLDKASKNAPASAQGAISQAQKLADCVTAAGTDTSALADCQAQFGG
jgi:predicted PurR-regulated permease PerM